MSTADYTPRQALPLPQKTGVDDWAVGIMPQNEGTLAMLTTIEGVYRDGTIELAEQPSELHGEIRVLVTFLTLASSSATSSSPDAVSQSAVRGVPDEPHFLADGLTVEEFDAVVDELAAMLPEVHPLPDDATGRQAIYEDHP